MALDRYIALIIAVIFLIYGYTAFFEMDGLPFSFCSDSYDYSTYVGEYGG